MIKKIKSRVQSQKRHAGRTCSGGRFILEDLLIDTEDFVRGTCWTPLTGSGNTGACWLGTERTGSWAGCTGEFTGRARVMDTGREDKEGRKSRNTTTSFRREVRLGRTSTGILEGGFFIGRTRTQCSKLAGARVHSATRLSLCAPKFLVWVHAVHPRNNYVVHFFNQKS